MNPRTGSEAHRMAGTIDDAMVQIYYSISSVGSTKPTRLQNSSMLQAQRTTSQRGRTHHRICAGIGDFLRRTGHSILRRKQIRLRMLTAQQNFTSGPVGIQRQITHRVYRIIYADVLPRFCRQLQVPSGVDTAQAIVATLLLIVTPQKYALIVRYLHAANTINSTTQSLTLGCDGCITADFNCSVTSDAGRVG